jgi:hypothetical protein
MLPFAKNTTFLRRLRFESLEKRIAFAIDLDRPDATWSIASQEIDSVASSSLSPSTSHPRAALNWVSAGPTAITGGQVEGITSLRVSGAVNALALHPTNANVAWIGTTNGGIWKTTNATATTPTWTPKTDEFPSLAIGAIAIDRSDNSIDTLWAGFGKVSSLGRDAAPPAGLLKSVNGGETWTQVTGGGALLGKSISGIVARGNTIVVSVHVATPDQNSNLGIFRSTNAGASFTQISGRSGSGLPVGLAYDLTADPTNDAILYTTIWNGPNDGVYKSTNRGSTWTRVSNSTINNRISSVTSNMELSVGKDNNVYLGIINQGILAGLFRSGNDGTNWAELDLPTTNENGQVVGIHPRPKGPGIGATPSQIAGGQGYLHFSIVADPVNANIVYVGGDRQPLETNPNSIGATDFSGRLFRVNASRPRGSQAIALTHNPTTNNDSAPHADSRDMAFAADGSLIEVDDGGIYRRTNPRTTGDWFSMHGNLQNTEMHSIDYDAISNTLVAGTQDVGTIVKRPNSTTWDSLTTGDGGVIEIDSQSSAGQNRSVRYTSFFRLGTFRKTIYNSANEIVASSNPALGVVGTNQTLVQFDTTLPFYTPIVLNSVNPFRGLVLSNAIYESNNQFESVASIGSSTSPFTASAYGGAGNEAVIYAANESGFFVRTIFGGSFNTITGYTGQSAVDLVLDSDDWRTGFIVDSNQVFLFLNAGATVNDITGNLNSVSGNSRIRSIAFVPGPTNASADAIVVGTDNGLYFNRSSSPQVWLPLGLNQAFVECDFG